MHDDSEARWWRLLHATSEIWADGAGRPAVVSAIIAPPDRLVSLGVNGLPQGIAETPQRLDPAGERAFWCEHSERAALYHALANGARVQGADVYSTMFPCADCMRGIIMAGIRAVRTPRDVQPSDAYRASVAVSRQMAIEASVFLHDAEPGWSDKPLYR